MTPAEPITPPLENTDDAQVFVIAPMDRHYQMSTGIILALFCVMPILILMASLLADGTIHWTAALAAVLLVLICGAITIVVRYYSRPVSFEINAEGMRIVWPWRTRKLPRGGFAEIRILQPNELGNMTRRLGAGGLFGAFGWYRSEYLNNLDAYVTRRNGMVYLRLVNRRPLLLTPDNPQEFLAALKAVAKDG